MPQAAVRAFQTHRGDDPAALAETLFQELEAFDGATRDDPFSNPVMRLTLDLSHRLESGLLDHAQLESLVQYLTAEGFNARANRLGQYMGEMDPVENRQRLRRLFERLVAPGEDGTPTTSFTQFQSRVETELFGIVITAHPTFNLSGDLMLALAELASNQDSDGHPLSDDGRATRVALAQNSLHRPDQMSLAREHTLSLQAIGMIQAALREVYAIALGVARDFYPDNWTDLTPRLITIATWVGYDLDGRSDIRWSDTLLKRLIVQRKQLRHYIHAVRALHQDLTDNDVLIQTLQLIESKLTLALNQADDEIEVLGANTTDDDDGDAHAQVRRMSQRMYERRETRLLDAAEIVRLLTNALERSTNDEISGRICVLRAEMATLGLGMAHSHMRINSTQLHNAIRKKVHLETTPDDPRFRQSYLNALNGMLDEVEPESVNFGSILAERTSAKRLMMVVRQMLRYIDHGQPIRFLIAESESAFTCLTALYFARQFGIDDRLDICPLFETERALQYGSRVIDQCLENSHFRRYVEQRGRLCVQLGYSDAGRYLGQTVAAASIERLKIRIVQLFAKHDLKNVQLIMFDTHGESIGRGGHPGGLAERLDYPCTDHWRSTLDDLGIPYKQEISFQGGDGYLCFQTMPMAFAAVTRILEKFLSPPDPAAKADPFYDQRSYVTEFFTTVKEFQVELMSDPNYGALLSAFGTNLLYPSGSRSIKRQHDIGAGGDIDYAHPSQFRAIPHNAVLQQLGLLANSIGGVGEAIDKDPEQFKALYESSPRFRQLMGIVRYGLDLTISNALKAYVDTMDPSHWLIRSAETADPHHAQERRKIADYLDRAGIHERQVKIFRRLYRDHTMLRQHLGPMPIATETGAAHVHRESRRALAVLHAVRLALMHEIFFIAVRVPTFSTQHNLTHGALVNSILHLDVPFAADALARIFPKTQGPDPSDDFGEPASYKSDESLDYSEENQELLQPMVGLYDLVRRTSTAVVHRLGFFG